MNNINNIQSYKNQITSINTKTEQPSKIDFKEILFDSIERVDSAEKKSNQMDELLATGKIENIHDAMIEAQKAELTLNYALAVKTKVIEAYKEIMRIQL